MSVELYFIRPDPEGRVVFPAWDEAGEPLPGVEYACIPSLKWAMGNPRLYGFGLGGAEPIAPERLCAGAAAALQALLAEVGALDPHYGWMVEDAGDDLEAVQVYLWAFVTRQDWVLGEPQAQDRAFALAEGSMGEVELLGRILEYGRRGYWGIWSY